MNMPSNRFAKGIYSILLFCSALVNHGQDLRAASQLHLGSSVSSIVPVRTVLFNGQNLKGWHTQGDGLWSVSGGVLAGKNPSLGWNHLLTDSAYGDSFLRLKFKNISGNSGLYFHSEVGGSYGVHGMQIEISPESDGSVMWVTTTAYAWVGQTTQFQRDSLVQTQTWTELAVWTKGRDFTIYLNGKKVLHGTAALDMALRGKFALQLHGGANNEIYFKDLEVSVPTLAKDCLDPLYLEYQKDLPSSDIGACTVTGLSTYPLTASRSAPWTPVSHSWHQGKLSNLLGRPVTHPHGLFVKKLIFPK